MMMIIIWVLVAIIIVKLLFDAVKNNPIFKSILRWGVVIGIFWLLCSFTSFWSAVGIIVIIALIGIILNIFD
jgi:hypothetical protein